MIVTWPITLECLIRHNQSAACTALGGAMHLVYVPLSLLGTMVAILVGFQTWLLRNNTSTYAFLKVCLTRQAADVWP
jgi:hypothetical protein